MTEHQSTYLVVYTGIVAFAVLVEAIALGALAFAAARLLRQITELTTEAKGKVYPILESVRDISEKGQHIAGVAKNIADDTEGKVKRVTANIADTSDVYRAKVAEVDSFVSDATKKAQRQSDRVDDMVSNVLTKTGEAASNLQQAVAAPFIKTAGVVSGAKAAVESFLNQNRTSRSRQQVPHPVAFEGENIYTGLEDDYHA